MTTTPKPVGRAVDITGQTFDGLTVIARTSNLPGKASAAWLCRCECGGETIATSSQLRKGERKSCGCRPGGPRTAKAAKSTKSPAAARLWHVVERDGFLALVRNPYGDEVLVEFRANPKAWVCSECGDYSIGKGFSGLLTCLHISAATRAMPPDLAQKIGDIVAPHKGSTLNSKGGSAAPGLVANEKAAAVALAKSAIERAERNEARDREYKGITAPVVVRQMTDEDRAKLEERRRAKSKTFAH